MRGSKSTQNRRYYPFVLKFEPNTRGREEYERLTATTEVRAYGWKDALNQADRLFDLDRVRFITHPANEGVGVALMDVPGKGEAIVGQVTATRSGA